MIIEPKNAEEMTDIMNSYKAKAITKKGAIMMAVCRGKLSEGIDFTDELARAVFLVGVPYPPTTDKKVECKKRYVDLMSKDHNNPNQKFTGAEWYVQQAVTSLN